MTQDDSVWLYSMYYSPNSKIRLTVKGRGQGFIFVMGQMHAGD